MFKDKDSLEMETLYEHQFSDFFLRSTKPVIKKVNISADVRITKIPKGWNVEVFDVEHKSFVPAEEFLSNLVLKKYSEDQKHYEKAVADMKARNPNL